MDKIPKIGIIKYHSIIGNAVTRLLFAHYLNITRDKHIKNMCEKWARWVVDSEVSGQYHSGSMGYGNPHQALLSGPPTGRTPNGPGEACIEMRIEGGLWRYQDMDGFSKEARHVEVFRAEYLARGFQRQKAAELGLSIATYKRWLALVIKYLENNVFDIIFEA
jgi:hypothetical protein